MKLLFILFLAIISLHVQADDPSGLNDNQRLRIADTVESKTSWPESDQLFLEGVKTLTEQVPRLNLLHWTLEKKFELPPEAYNRKKHFGTWVDDPRDQTCQNTRAKVLIRDSQTKVKFKADNPCSVAEGTWVDPYAGFVLKSSEEVQIDHLVPLKNAYISGGWAWSSKKRCLYANFLANKFHLLTVDAHENLSKGDSTPENYLPSNRAFICQYLKNWLKVKMIWNLEMTGSEARAIREKIKDYGCSEEEFAISQNELAKQRTATETWQVICH